MRVAAYAGLGLVSAGILAGVLAIALKRRSDDAADAMSLDGENGTPRNTSLSSSRDTKLNAIWPTELGTSKYHSSHRPNAHRRVAT